MKRVCILTVGLLIASWGYSKDQTILQLAESKEASQWADSVYNTMSPIERVGQLLSPKYHFTEPESTLERYVKENHVGGLLFSVGTLKDYVDMTNYAQSMAKVPLLMTFDGEWGPAMRINEAIRYPSNMTLGAIQDAELLYQYGREVGRQLRLIGQHVDLAPVADVNSNPKNPVIGYRSFGEDPKRVAVLSTAMAKGLEDSGVQAVAKHFPGHGDTDTDSHAEKTTVNHTAEVFEAVDLVPFKDYIDNGLSGVMTGHIVAPGLDDSGLPASLSKKITTDILRDKMGFQGLIYTDALTMKGARIDGKSSEVEAFKAGADVLLSAGDPAVDVDSLMAQIQTGQISWKTIEDRCKRILRYKYALGLPDVRSVEMENLLEKINSPEAKALNEALANASITVLRNENNILPIGNLAKNKIAVVNIGAYIDNNFIDLCRKYADVRAYASVKDPFSQKTLEDIRKHDVVVAAVYSDSAYCKEIFRQLYKMPGLVSVFMMDPYKMSKFTGLLDNSKAVVLAYENLPALRSAAAMALFGGINVDGKLPVNIPGFPMGTGIDISKSRLGYTTPVAEGMSAALPEKIDSIVAKAIADGAMPGCQVLVARNGNVVFEKAYGNITKDGPEVNDNTLYDLASVSKVIGTLPGVMKVYDLGLIDLDTPAAEYIPGLKKTGKKFTPRQMLYHETGMPAAINVYTLMLDKDGKLRRDITAPDSSAQFPWEAAKGIWVGQATVDTIMNVIYNQKLRPTSEYNYSCLNFCLLLDMEQRVTGQPHEKWMADSVFGPLGQYNTFYRPSLHAPLDRIVPTENDSLMRHQIVHGYVHDETAAMQGGVSGNAGLFANASDIAKLCQTWLQGGKYGDVRIYSPETVDLFMTSKSPTCRRGLGFDKSDPNPENSPTCEEASLSVVGHTGFTGTIFWIDPDEDLIYIFLANRVNPSRITPAFAKSGVRSKIFSEIYHSLNK